MKSPPLISPPMRIFQILLGVIALAGIFVIGALVVEPSQSGGFLGFSTGRWAILLFNLLTLFLVSFTLFKISAKENEDIKRWLSDKKRLFSLLYLSFLLLIFSIPAALGEISEIRHFIYFGRIQPSLIWLAFSNSLFFLMLLFILRHPIQDFFPSKAIEQKKKTLGKSQLFLMLGAGVIYIFLQVFSILEIREAKWLADSVDYILPANIYNWNDPHLWIHTKPWGAAVLYKLIGTSPITINLTQTLLSTIAWMSLAWVFSRTIQNQWLKVISFIFILGFSLAPSIEMWNHIILSESLSITLMVLILADWLSLLDKWHWGKFIILIPLFAWWIGTRETNIYLSLLIASILALIGFLYKKQRFYWILTLFLIIFSYGNMQTSKALTIKRWLIPLTNVVLNRILPNEDYLDFFKEKNMPTPPELLALSGGFAGDENFAVYNSVELDDVEKWLLQSGKNVYVQFLISHPIYTLTSPWGNSKELLSSKLNYASSPHPTRKWLFGEIFYPNSLWLLLILVFATFITLKLALPLENNPNLWLLFFFLALFFPHIYLVWHGDSFEVSRHAVQASVQLRLALWLLFSFALDKVILGNAHQKCD